MASLLEDLVPDLIEVVEHVAYSHNFRTEDAQKRVGSLLSGIRIRLGDWLAQRAAEASTPAPAPVEEPAPAPVVTAPAPTPADVPPAPSEPPVPEVIPAPVPTSATSEWPVSGSGSPASAPIAVSGDGSAVVTDPGAPSAA